MCDKFDIKNKHWKKMNIMRNDKQKQNEMHLINNKVNAL